MNRATRGIVGRDQLAKDIYGELIGIVSKYISSSEAEEILHGVLRWSEVREGPNTRDMSFRMIVDADELGVYVSGFDQEKLRPFVDHPVKVVGKRVDLRPEGYGVEIWIGSIALDDQ